MAENNDFDFNNQTPLPNGNKPDYSYKWDGTERNRNNKSGFNIAIITVVALILATVVISAFMISDNIFSSSDDKNESSNVEDISITSEPEGNGGPGGFGGQGGENKPPKDDKPPKNDNEVPNFTPSGDSNLDLSTTLSEIYENCSPSCCTISVTYGMNSGRSIGSGFVIDAENGYIATNHHVIDEAADIKVVFYDGKEYKAQLIGSDAVTDLAVLKIEAEGLVQVELGDSNAITIGENVVAIGTPYDITLAGTMTTGIISGVKRNVDMTNDSGKVIKTMTLIQTDCSINPGNSGGPLIDMAGNVIGITSLKLVDEQYEGIGFAIPITDATEIFKKLIAGEDVGESDIASATPLIGITVTDVETGLYYLGIRPSCEYPEKGVFIYQITASSSAYKAGVGAYNIIVDFNGDKIENGDDLSNALAKYKAGATVQMTVFQFNRNFNSGEYKTIEFKLDAAK